MTPPVQYMQACHSPALAGETNGDLAEYASSLKSALRLCNADKSALRAWAEKINPTNTKD